MELPFAIAQEMTTPSKPGKQPRPVYVIRDAPYVYADMMRECGGRKYHGAWSFFTDPTEALTAALARGPRSFAEQQAAKAERAEARAERRDEWAEKAARASNAAHAKARQMFDAIPPGQPLLVDHYSYKRDRNYRDRAWNTLGKAVKLSEKAEHHQHRAAAAEHTAEVARGNVSYGFAQRRIAEAEAGIRKCDRGLAKDGADDAHWSTWKAEYTAKRDHWRAILETLTPPDPKAEPFRPDTIAKGDEVWSIMTRSWHEVLRVNQKSLTVRGLYPNRDGTPSKYTIPYEEVREHRTKQVA